MWYLQASLNQQIKLFDHSKPANRDEWVFAFVSEYRKLRPEIGEKHAKVVAFQAHGFFGALEPAKAAQKWAKGIQQ